VKQKQMPETTYLINDVSQRVGLSQKRIREYEKGGLLKPAREPSTNNRLYTERDIRQILQIKALIHEHGFTLASLRHMVANMACWVVFGCEEKASCPAYAAPLTPCYEVAWKTETEKNQAGCENCPIYLNRDVQKMTLLNKIGFASPAPNLP